MPVKFPEWDDTENRLVERDYFSLSEVATMLHMSRSTAYEAMRAERWPYLKVARRVWISQTNLRTILDQMRHNDDGTAYAEGDDDGPALGLAMPPDDDGDQDPGGVR